MSDAMTAMLERRSIRKYKSDMIPRETLESIIEAGLWAASGRNKQAGMILAVTNRALRDKLSAMNAKIMGAPEGHDPFYGAPVVLVVLANKEVGTYVYDGSLVMGNLMLAAHELGVGSCWIHRAKEEFESEEGKAILRELGVEGDYEGVGHCILGYADCDMPAAPARRGGNVFWAE
ncbi:MAG: nitroreductase [Clostridia bacterium]|nr:nitroreductase [Clostridia bacterium]